MKEKSFVITDHTSDSSCRVIYVGTNKANALDALLSYGKTVYCELSRVKYQEESVPLKTMTQKQFDLVYSS